MKWAFVVSVLAAPLWAEDADRAQSCLATGRVCSGMFVDECLAEVEDTGIIPVACWQRELAAWQIVLDRAYSKVLLETFSAPKSVTRTIREEHEAWGQYRDLRCAVQSISNPRTYGSIETACRANMTYQRILDVNGLIGADWRE